MLQSYSGAMATIKVNVCRFCGNTVLPKLSVALFNPFTGVGAILRPVRVVCSKNHKKSPERAMFFLNVPADAEKISLPRGIFCEVKKCRLLCSTSR